MSKSGSWGFTPCRRVLTGFSAWSRVSRRPLLCEEDLPEAYFDLGIAYKQAYRYADAEKAFKKVIWIHESLVSEAKEELESVEKILRPGPRSPITPK